MSTKKTGSILVNGLIWLGVLIFIGSLILPVIQKHRTERAHQTSVEQLYRVGNAMEKHFLETGKYPVFSRWPDVIHSSSPLRAYMKVFPSGWEYRVVFSTEYSFLFEKVGAGDQSNVYCVPDRRSPTVWKAFPAVSDTWTNEGRPGDLTLVRVHAATHLTTLFGASTTLRASMIDLPTSIA